MNSFPSDIDHIYQRIESIDPISYGRSRNYVDGAVTYLSPYISRGVISTRQVLLAMLKKGYKLNEMESFIKELSWRDYFQRTAQVKSIEQPIKQEQHPIRSWKMPAAIIHGNTGIVAIDKAINELYATGYMHNHARMYTASIVCNIAQCLWKLPAKWMYYHLLDGDWASNNLSWAWVAGSNSLKKYYANQENINRYMHSNQRGTFLDVSYEDFPELPVPAHLLNDEEPQLSTRLPHSETPSLDPSLPTYLYNYYNLDPFWAAGEKANRILLLEPSHFKAHPVSEKCLQFALDLGKNISGLQLFVGEFESLKSLQPKGEFHYKEHPLAAHYEGIVTPRDWIVNEIEGYHPSFFAYWKAIQKYLKAGHD